MFLNYSAGAISLLLAVSVFIPWITVWFYSLKGIESVYGIIILVVGLLGTAVAIFQHLSGKARGKSFIIFSAIAFICEILYFRKIASYGSKLNEILALLTDFLGDTLTQKMNELLGEQWTKIISKIIERFGFNLSINGFDFVGGGLILATICTFILLILGIFLEKLQPSIEIEKTN